MRRTVSAALVGLAGCAFNPLMPDPRTASDRAREVVDRCADLSPETDAEVLSPSIILKVDPSYNYVQSGNDHVERLRGARLRVKAKGNLSAETVELSLECHQAKVTLGSAQELEHDPYVFRGTWLDIDTRSAGDGFVVAVQVDSVDKARAVLDRARQFIASRQ